MSAILKKAQHYKRVSNILYESRRHLTDPYTPTPQILKVYFLRNPFGTFTEESI